MKEIKVTIEGLGSTDTPMNVRINLLDSGKVIDTIIVQLKPPYDSLGVYETDKEETNGRK